MRVLTSSRLVADVKTISTDLLSLGSMFPRFHCSPVATSRVNDLLSVDSDLQNKPSR